jgi:hypothetical protein
LGSKRESVEKCRKGIEALKLFRTEWDQDKRVFKRKALHDWTSHAADAFAYLALTLDSGTAGDAFHRTISYPSHWIA